MLSSISQGTAAITDSVHAVSPMSTSDSTRCLYFCNLRSNSQLLLFLLSCNSFSWIACCLFSIASSAIKEVFFAAVTIIALYTEFVLAMLTFDLVDALEYLDFVRALVFLTESSERTRRRLSPRVAEKILHLVVYQSLRITRQKQSRVEVFERIFDLIRVLQ